jgi:hypothetical protein
VAERAHPTGRIRFWSDDGLRRGNRGGSVPAGKRSIPRCGRRATRGPSFLRAADAQPGNASRRLVDRQDVRPRRVGALDGLAGRRGDDQEIGPRAAVPRHVRERLEGTDKPRAAGRQPRNAHARGTGSSRPSATGAGMPGVKVPPAHRNRGSSARAGTGILRGGRLSPAVVPLLGWRTADRGIVGRPARMGPETGHAATGRGSCARP